MSEEALNINIGPEPTKDNIIIKVVGVGGGGSNAVTHMYKQNIPGVSYLICNTDQQALNMSAVPDKLLLGPNTTHGLGAGNKPEVAAKAAEESAKEIAEKLSDDTRMVFITAGMGGGTGTGAAPVVARIAREKGILTIGIVTIPFLFEGQKKVLKALDGAEKMKEFVDAILIINNERICDIYKDLEFHEAFAKADDTLSIAASSISELISKEAYINLDFNDVNTTLKDSGVAVISSGYGEGEGRVTKAIEDALKSPLLKNRDVEGSKHILFNIYYSRNAERKFVMNEANEVTAFMNRFNAEIDVIWGVGYDDTLGDKVKITVLASGFTVSEQDLRDDSKKPLHKGKKDVEPIKIAGGNDQQKIIDAYGSDKVLEHERSVAQVKYIVLSPEEFDCQEALNLFEKHPTFNRSGSVKDAVAEAVKRFNSETETIANKQQEPLVKPKADEIIFG